MENDNKKTLILSIIGILVLVIAVVGVSFAMYSFTGTGTKANVIQTGTINFDVDTASPDGSFEFTNKYPMTDAQGVAQTGDANNANIKIDADWGSAPMTINYDLGLEFTEGTTLKAQHIKVALLDGDGNVVVGTTKGTTNLTGGVTIASLASVAGPNNLITAYGLTGGTITQKSTINYSIKAWVSDQYDLDSKVDAANTTSDQDASGTLDDASGTLHKKQTASDTFKFKVVIKATQA